MPATVTVGYLGDAAVERQIREGMEKELEMYDPSWHVSILGSAWNDTWVIKLTGGEGQVHSVKKLNAHQTVVMVIEEAAHMVRTAHREQGNIAS
jgi:hypothetical protein